MREVKSIQTEYKGILFRSRLEARWAAFFDGMGWEWSYEPLDRPQWIPDFSVVCAGMRRFVEVKPAQSMDELEALALTGQQLADAPDGTLLLGCQPFGSAVGLVMHVSRSLGPKALDADRDLLRAIEVAHEARTKAGKRTVRVEHMAKTCGLRPCREVATGPLEVDVDLMARAWPRAMNSTQWKSPKKVEPKKIDPDDRVLTPDETVAAAAKILSMLGPRPAEKGGR
jgi:hypothetical protein